MDFYLFHFLNQWAGQWLCLDALAIFLAEYLGYLLVGFLIAWFIWDLLFTPHLFKKGAGFRKEKYQRTIKIVSLSFGAALFSRLAIVELIRWFYYRPRPFLTGQVNQLISHSASGSFPSGHGAFFFALSTVVYLYNKKAGLLFFLASFLIGLSRIFAGLHYPSDILAGAIIGIFFGWLANRLFAKY